MKATTEAVFALALAAVLLVVICGALLRMPEPIHGRVVVVEVTAPDQEGN